MHNCQAGRLAWSLQEESDAAALFADPTMDEVRLQVLWEAAVKVSSRCHRATVDVTMSVTYSAPALKRGLAGHAQTICRKLSAGSCPASCTAESLLLILLRRPVSDTVVKVEVPDSSSCCPAAWLICGQDRGHSSGLDPLSPCSWPGHVAHRLPVSSATVSCPRPQNPAAMGPDAGPHMQLSGALRPLLRHQAGK